MKIISECEGVIYYNIQNELIFFEKNSKQYKKWLHKPLKQKLQSLRDKKLLL